MQHLSVSLGIAEREAYRSASSLAPPAVTTITHATAPEAQRRDETATVRAQLKLAEESLRAVREDILAQVSDAVRDPLVKPEGAS